MSLETDLVAALKVICPRTFTDFAPALTPRPYITFQQIGGDVVKYVGKEVPSIENGEIQINVWADTRTAAKTMIKQIEAALIVATTFDAKPVAAASSDFDSDMERYCSLQSFSIWADR